MEGLKRALRPIVKVFGEVGRIKGWQYQQFGSFSHIRKPIRIIGKKYIAIGKNVHILDGARIEAISKWGDKCYSPELVFMDNISIGQNFHCIATGGMKIGSHTTISANCYIADCKHNYTDINVDVCAQKLLHQDTEIGEYCFIGYGAVILPGVKLGKQCIVGANSVVLSGNYDDYIVLAGTPARVVKRYNSQTALWEKE